MLFRHMTGEAKRDRLHPDRFSSALGRLLSGDGGHHYRDKAAYDQSPVEQTDPDDSDLAPFRFHSPANSLNYTSLSGGHWRAVWISTRIQTVSATTSYTRR